MTAEWSMSIAAAREARVAEMIGAVARQAMADRGLSRVVVVSDGGPETHLAERLLKRALGDGAVSLADVFSPPVAFELRGSAGLPPEAMRTETARFFARLSGAGALLAHPANKTALLLGGELPPEPLLPLGDLWASDVAELARGEWSAPEPVRQIVDAAGGIEALDAALRRWIDRRDPAGLDALPDAAADAVRRAFAAGRASRLHSRITPKLGPRTLGIDLFE